MKLKLNEMKMIFLNPRKLFLVLSTGLMVLSCSKEETPSDSIVGTWTTGTTTLAVMVGAKTLTQYFTDVMGLTAAQAQQYATLFNQGMQQAFTGTIQIKADNTYVANMGGETDNGTWSLSADGKKLTIDSSQDVPVEYDVSELTSSKLRIIVTESESNDLNGDNIPEIITISIDMTFTR